jgi:ElaB/YqjD/DUF883 family membrane-anchored ribosome-binding protein
MSSCPWLNARGLSSEDLLGKVADCVMPHMTATVDAVEDGLAALSDQARARPRQALLVAGAAGLALGLFLASRQR